MLAPISRPFLSRSPIASVISHKSDVPLCPLLLSSSIVHTKPHTTRTTFLHANPIVLSLCSKCYSSVLMTRAASVVNDTRYIFFILCRTVLSPPCDGARDVSASALSFLMPIDVAMPYAPLYISMPFAPNLTVFQIPNLGYLAAVFASNCRCRYQNPRPRYLRLRIPNLFTLSSASLTIFHTIPTPLQSP